MNSGRQSGVLMRRIGASLAVLAMAGLVGGQAFAQAGPIAVGDAPVHAVPSDDAGPVDAEAVPGTLNAQYAERAKPVAAPVRQSRPVEGPAVAFAPQLIDAAGAFDAYMRKAAGIDPKFVDGGAVAKAVNTGAGYEIQQFQEGLVAYAALAALQDPAFVRDLSDIARDPRDRDAMADRLAADPGAVMEIDGADEAAAMVGGVLVRMGVDLLAAGKSIKQSAYEVQHQAWSKEATPDPQRRLAETKSQSAAKISLDAAQTDELIKTIVALRKAGAGQGGRGGQPSPVVLRGLSLAALAVFGRAGEADLPRLAPLLSDAKSADCMKMAKLNLYQCMAVAGPHYEDVFCLGQHALIDTGQCVIAAAGGQSAVSDAQLQAVSAPVSRSVSVPIALSAGAGPEQERAYAPVPEADRTAREAVVDEPPAPAVEPPLPPPPPRTLSRQEAAREAAGRDDRDDEGADERSPDRYPSYAERAPVQRTYRDDRPSYAPPQAPDYPQAPAYAPPQAPAYGSQAYPQSPAYGQPPAYAPQAYGPGAPRSYPYPYGYYGR